MSDHDYKVLLDAQAIARRIQKDERKARATAMNCADGIESLIAQLEQIREEESPAVVAPY